MKAIKQLILKPLLLPGFPALLKYVQRDCATIFMLHRFNDPQRGVSGCDALHLRRTLAYLASKGYEMVSLMELFDRLGGSGRQARGAVAFTIDDGYVDQATIAAPVFSEFGCPVTTFVSTGFVDGKLWFWWDQVEYIFRHATRKSARLHVGAAELSCQWESDKERDRAQDAFIATCKLVSEANKSEAIARLAQILGVSIPAAPPPHCAPMSWEQVRQCEEMGMTFAPHTVTHPVLSRSGEDMAEREIAESWAHLRSKTRNAVPIFSYPHGELDDFGDREIAILRRLGFLGAVTGEPGYANARSFKGTDEYRFKVQRFGFPDGLPHVIQYVSGIERFKQMFRGNT